MSEDEPLTPDRLLELHASMQEYMQERADPMFETIVEVFKNSTAHLHDSGSYEEADAEVKEFACRYKKLVDDLKNEYVQTPQIKQIFDLPNTGPTSSLPPPTSPLRRVKRTRNVAAPESIMIVWKIYCPTIRTRPLI
jgi:hypothetical protein